MEQGEGIEIHVYPTHFAFRCKKIKALLPFWEQEYEKEGVKEREKGLVVCVSVYDWLGLVGQCL
jgi:hypothetical protein